MNQAKHSFILLAISLLPIVSSGQVKFESGYIINNNGERIFCQIKNMGWLDNPEQFEYKTDENGEIFTGTINDISVFEIYGMVKYERFNIKLSRSSKKMSSLYKNDTINFIHKAVFLCNIVESKNNGANLYSYKKGELRKYCYSIGDSEPEALVYRKYSLDTGYILSNQSFKQKLFLDLSGCPEITLEYCKGLRYAEGDLRKIIKLYNTCIGENYTERKARSKIETFNIWISSGLNFSSLVIDNVNIDNRKVVFGKQVDFMISCELEWLPPSRNNNWALYLAPTISSYDAKKTVVYTEDWSGERTTNVVVDYPIFEIPLGIRYYVYNGTRSKLFLSTAISPKINMGGRIYSDVPNIFDLNLIGGPNLEFEAGYIFNDKLRLMIRQSLKQSIVAHSGWPSKYNSITVSFGYNLF